MIRLIHLRTKIEAPPVKAAVPTAAGAAKIPSWDMKSRLQAMEGMTHKLQSQMSALTNQLAAKEKELKVVEETKEILKVDLTQFSAETESMQQRVRELLRTIDEENSKHRLEVDQLSAKLMNLQGKLDSLESQLSTSRSECDRLRSSISSTSEQLETVSKDLATTREKLRVTKDLGEDRYKKIQELEKVASKQQESVDYLDSKSRDDEEVRRKLSNTIQELKGNIRVYLRVRPPTPEELDASVQYQFSRTDDSLLEIVSTQNKELSGCKNAPEKRYNYKFDKVFAPEVSQDSIFKEMNQIVRATLDGCNTCIFAYGPTGSGKTHTLEGTDGNLGMIPRSVEFLFEHSYKMAEKGWDFKFVTSYIEVNQDTMRDLLYRQKAGMPAQDEKRFEIKHDSEGRVFVANMTMHQVVAPHEIVELLQLAQQNRETIANWAERSARSHTVFQIRIHANNRKNDKSFSSQLNFVDLAGSEKVLVPPAQAATMNRGIYVLNEVISALANKEKNVPYKTSKLTYLLQDSLGPNSKTMFFVNVAPGASNLSETLNSLRYAQKVNACEIGTARK
jgi:kinesin family member C1